MSEALVQLGEEIKAALPGAVTEAVVAFEELTVHAEAASIVEVPVSYTHLDVYKRQAQEYREPRHAASAAER